MIISPTTWRTLFSVRKVHNLNIDPQKIKPFALAKNVSQRSSNSFHAHPTLLTATTHVSHCFLYIAMISRQRSPKRYKNNIFKWQADVFGDSHLKQLHCPLVELKRHPGTERSRTTRLLRS